MIVAIIVILLIIVAVGGFGNFFLILLGAALIAWLIIRNNSKKAKKNPSNHIALADGSPSGECVAASPASRGFLPGNKKEAEFMAPQWIKQAQDCTRLVNDTANPKVFFDRYDMLIDVCKKLVHTSRWVKFKGTPPDRQLQEILETRPAATTKFIERYADATQKKIDGLSTQKGKANRANIFLDTLTQYSDRIDNDNVVYYSMLHEEMINGIGE